MIERKPYISRLNDIEERLNLDHIGKSMKERIDNIEDHLQIKPIEAEPPRRTFKDRVTGRKSLKKEFALPKKIKAGHKRKLKQNYAVVVYIRTNGWIDIQFEPIVNDLIYIRQTGLYYAATAEYVMRYKQYPMVIQPEWAVTPFSPKDHEKATNEEGKSALAQKVYIQIMKMAAMGGPKKFGGKTILWIIVGGVALLYLLSQIIGV